MALEREPLTGKQKAAVICLALGEDIAAEIFKRLDDREVQEISREISLMAAVSPEITDKVLEEFYHLTIGKKYMTTGGIEYAKKVLVKSLGPEAAQEVTGRLNKLMENTTWFSALEKVSAHQLAKVIQDEHPQTIALILAHLSAARAAEVIAALPGDMRGEIVIRLANLEEISPGIVKKIAAVLDRKLEVLGTYTLEEYGGVKAAAELFSRMDRRVSRDVLEQIESRDPGLTAAIKDLVFVFEDILLVDDQGIMEVLKQIDKKSLAMALKGANEEIKAKFFKNMSKRAVEILKEEMEYLGPTRIKEIERAQHEIVEMVRILEEEGMIIIGEVEADDYVA